ncbi:MAG TPA: tetratricopeptide repeat protein [Pyrinomonadaceae bacterium]|jgi:tetratricopeptide (TPR) repeat protein
MTNARKFSSPDKTEGLRLLLSALFALCLACALVACKSGGQQAVDTQANANLSGNGVVPTQEQTQAQRLLNEGNELYKNDQDEQAIEAYKKAIELDPNNGEAYFRIGLAYMATGKRDEAEESFKKSVDVYEKYLRTNQKDAQSYYILGQALVRLGNYQEDRAKAPKVYLEAVAALKKAVAIEPENADMYYELGVAYNRLFQYQDAVKAFEKATELDPSNYRASDALDKAKEDLDRFNSIYRGEKAKIQQEESRRRRDVDDEENGNGNNNANTSVRPRPSPTATKPSD